MYFSLRNKTILGVALIEAILLIILVFTAVNFMRNTLNEDLTKRAFTVATLFATTTKNSVLSYDLASLDAYCIELMKNPDVAYVRVISDSGQLFAHAGNEKLLSKPFSLDKEVKSVDDGVFDSFAEIIESGHLYGRVEVGLDITSIEKSIKRIQQWTSSIALIEMLLVALFSYALGTYLTSQLQNLRDAAKNISQDISSGQFRHAKVQIKSKDEIADVADAFNKLVTNLDVEHSRRETYRVELEELNKTLEEKVVKRTNLLNNRNEQLVRTNQELKDAQQQLVQAEKLASVGQLAAGVAHEINNPIGFVGSNLSSLAQYMTTYRELSAQVNVLLNEQDVEQKAKLEQALKEYVGSNNLVFINEDTQELLNESIEGMNRVKNIVKDLKQFSRADADEKQWFDINDCINSTLNMVSNELKYHCEIEKHLDELPKVCINVGKICQVLTNLLINAGQAIDENGHIKINTQFQEGNILIAVSDNGSGIKDEHLSKLFDPFFTTKEEGVGTGLGLSISYGIIKEHGGEIRVATELGKGTCFTLFLPLKDLNSADMEYTE
jgi:C4-dicarboxylate-specific signal transduction histidine kinase